MRGQQIHQSHGHFLGRLTRTAGVKKHEPGFGLQHGIVAGADAIGAVSGEVSVDEARIFLRKSGIIGMQLLGIAGLVAGQNDVSLGSQAVQRGLAGGGGQIEHQRLFTPIGSRKIR